MLNGSSVPAARGGKVGCNARSRKSVAHESLLGYRGFCAQSTQVLLGGKPVRTSKSCVVIFCLCAYFSFGLSRSFAQKLNQAQEAELKFLLKLEARLGPDQAQLLSRPVRNAIAFAHQVFDTPQLAGDDDGGGFNLGLHSADSGSASVKKSAGIFKPALLPAAKTRPTDLLAQEVQGGLTKISHPEIGFQLSRYGFFSDTQSSSAQCGNNIATAFVSETAAAFSAVIPQIQDFSIITAASQLTTSVSNDGGATFTQAPALTVGPSTDSNQPAGATGTLFSVLGNPVAACSSSQRFYVANSPFFVADITFFEPFIFQEQLFSGVGVNISQDGGQSWGNTAPAILKDQDHFIDSGWLVVDPNNPDRLYVSYIDFDFEADFPFIPHPSPRCAATTQPVERIASEMVTSADGGRTWSSPRIIREDCLPVPRGAGNTGQGFHVGSARLTVGGDGRVTAAYLLFHPIFASDGVTVVDYKLEVHARQSSNRGVTFGSDIKVSDLVQVGEGSHTFRPFLQGFIPVPTIPVLAADPVTRGKKQNLYIAWADGRDNQIADPAGPFGTYSFADILLSRSTDGGLTWSPPQAISPTPKDFKGPGRDQFNPSIAVDHDGAIAVCYYDRRNDPQNNAFDRYCSISQSQGQSFHDLRQSPKSWMFGEDWDQIGFWLGDYDTVVAPSFGGGNGFFGAFGVSGDDMTGIFGRSIARE